MEYNITLVRNEIVNTLTISRDGGNGVQTVTGSAVDNTDPKNPIVNLPDGGGNVDSVNDVLPDENKNVALTTENIPEFTDRNYQTDDQKEFNDFTSSGQTQINNLQNELPISAQGQGIIADGVTIVSDELQALINSNVGKKILLGNDKNAVFLIDKALIVPTNSILEINGQIKLANGNIRNLLANLSNGANTTTVANAGDYFKVGQRIVISDDNQPINGGGAWKTRKVGQTNVIQSIVGDTITFTNTFSNWINGGVTVAANAKISQANNIFLINGSNNILIYGDGILDGNLANQYNIAGADYNRSAEDLSASCGISFIKGCTDSEVYGLEIKNMVMHGVVSYQGDFPISNNRRIRLDNLEIHGQVDKAICLLGLQDSTISNIYNYDGIDEGEIAFYAGNFNINVSNIRSKNNRRYGIGFIGTNWNVNLTNIILDGNLQGDLYMSDSNNINFTNIAFVGNVVNAGYLTLSTCFNIQFSQIAMKDLSVNVAMLGISLSTNIKFNSVNIINGSTSTSTTAGVVSVSDSSFVTFNDLSINTVGIALRAIGTNSNIVFNNPYFINCGFLCRNNETDTRLTGFIFLNGKGQYNFQISSTALVSSGNTKVTVSHKFFKTPDYDDIVITPISLGVATNFIIQNITRFSFDIVLNTDPLGTGALFNWRCATNYSLEIPRPTITQLSISNFSAGVDGYSSSGGTADGNIDGISGINDTLRFYANTANTGHFVSKTGILTAGVRRITFDVFIPATNTKVNGCHIWASSTPVCTFNNLQTGVWITLTTPEFTLASVSSLLIYQSFGTTTTFIGAGSVTDDLFYLKNIKISSIT